MIAVAAGDELARAIEQVVVHAVQRHREADAARKGIVQVNPRLVAQLVGQRRPAAGGPGLALRLVALAEGQPQIAAVAHEQQRGDALHRKAEPDDAVAPVVLAPRQRLHHRRRHGEPVGGGVHLVFGQIQFARPDILVGVELDLLEADDATGDVDVAMRRNVQLGGRPARAR